MEEYWYWEIRFHVVTKHVKKKGVFTVDRQNAATASEAQKQLLNVYEKDLFRLVDLHNDPGPYQLIIDSCSRVAPDFDILKPYLKDFDF